MRGVGVGSGVGDDVEVDGWLVCWMFSEVMLVLV